MLEVPFDTERMNRQCNCKKALGLSEIDLARRPAGPKPQGSSSRGVTNRSLNRTSFCDGLRPSCAREKQPKLEHFSCSIKNAAKCRALSGGSLCRRGSGGKQRPVTGTLGRQEAVGSHSRGRGAGRRGRVRGAIA